MTRGTLDPHAERFLAVAAGAPPLDTLTVDEGRATLQSRLSLTGRVRPMASVRDLDIGGVPTRVYAPTEFDGPAPCTVYFHGGGWVLGDLDIADTTSRDLASHSHTMVVSVDYRRSPEVPFPGPLDDALAVVRAVLSGASGLDVDTQRVAVAGDSAGGNLAAVVAQELRDHEPRIAHQALIYPVADLSSMDTASYREFGDGHHLTRRNLEYFYACYAGDHDRTDIRLSPGRNPDLADLPSATVLTAGCDPLRDEGEAYAQAMAEAGTPVTSVRFHGQIHPFVYFPDLFPAADAARRFVGSQIRAALSAD